MKFTVAQVDINFAFSKLRKQKVWTVDYLVPKSVITIQEYLQSSLDLHWCI